MLGRFDGSEDLMLRLPPPLTVDQVTFGGYCYYRVTDKRFKVGNGIKYDRPYQKYEATWFTESNCRLKESGSNLKGT